MAATTSKDANKQGILYITDNLIKRVSKSENLEYLTTLNLDLNSSDGKRIKCIEKLEHLRSLQMLKLSHNVIERIEKLHQLTQLRELDLSYNKIKRIEGLEKLVFLATLRLRGNLIEVIPVWFSKKLTELQMLDLAENQISSLHEVSRLSNLQNLHQLDVRDNPLMELPHAWQFLIFHLSTLDQLNAVKIESSDRQEATDRFNRSEVDRIQKQLEDREKEVQTLNDKMAKQDRDAKMREERERDIHKKLKKDIREKQELQDKIKLQETMLKKKSEELMRACNKHYELEQELAFYKIDSKFHHLGKAPAVSEDNSYTHSTEGSDNDHVGDSPYVGKGRFAENKFAILRRESVGMQQAHLLNMSDPQLVGQVTGGNGDGSSGRVPHDGIHYPDEVTTQHIQSHFRPQSQLLGNGDANNSGSVTTMPQVSLDSRFYSQEARLEEMERLLEEKHQQIVEAERHLILLQEAAATGKPGGSERPMKETSDSNELLRDRLQEDMNSHVVRLQQFSKSANHLKNEIQVTEGDLQTGLSQLELIQKQAMELEEKGDSSQQVQTIQLKKQIRDQEVQVTSTEQRLVNLKAQLEKVLAAIQRETDVIQHLEKRIIGTSEDGSPRPLLKASSVIPEQFSAELNALVTGLKDYFAESKEIESNIEKRRHNESDSVLRVQRRLAEEKRKNVKLMEQLQEQQKVEATRSEKTLLMERNYLKSQERIMRLEKNLQALYIQAEAEKEEIEAQLEAERERVATVEHKQRMTARVREKAVSLENLNRQLNQHMSRLSHMQRTQQAASEQEILLWSNSLRDWTERLQSGEMVQDIVQEIEQTTVELLDGAIDHGSISDQDLVNQGVQVSTGLLMNTVPRLNMQLHNLLLAATKSIKRTLRQEFQDYQYSTEKEMHQLREQVLQYMEEIEEPLQYEPSEKTEFTAQIMQFDSHSSSGSTESHANSSFELLEKVPTTLTQHLVVPPLALQSSRETIQKKEDTSGGENQFLPSPNIMDVGANEYAQHLLRILNQTKRAYSKEMTNMHQEVTRLQNALMERSRKDPSGMSSIITPRVPAAGNSLLVPSEEPVLNPISKLTSDLHDPSSTCIEDELNSTFPLSEDDESKKQTSSTAPSISSHPKHKSVSHKGTSVSITTQKKKRESKPKVTEKHSSTGVQHSGFSFPRQTSHLPQPNTSSHRSFVDKPVQGDLNPPPYPFVDQISASNTHTPHQRKLPHPLSSAHSSFHKSEPPQRSIPKEDPQELDDCLFEMASRYSNNDGSSSEERGLLMELKRELDRLKRQLETTEMTHMHKMENALQHIGSLEEEIHRRDVEEKMVQEEMTRAAWEKQLNDTLRELDTCQQNIMHMQKRLDQRNNQERNDTEMQNLHNILNEQKQEIVRLNSLLDRLAGVRIVDSLENGGQWNHPNTGHGAVRPATVLGTPFHNQYPPRHMDNHPWNGNPLLSASTPALNMQQPHMPNIPFHTDGAMNSANSLYCNVTEHHRLEDYLQQLYQKNSALRKQLKEKRLQYDDEEFQVLQKLRHEVDKKKDALSDVTIELEQRQLNLDQLQSREKLLVKNVDELQRHINTLQQQKDMLESETFMKENAMHNERELNAMKQAMERQNYLQEEINCLEETLAKRNSEFKQAETLLSQAREDLQSVREEARDTINRFDEARIGYSRTILECEELEKRAREASSEVVRSNNDTMELRGLIKSLEVQKRQLQISLEDVKRVLQQKDEEYQELERQLRLGATNLRELFDSLTLAKEQEHEKMECIQEADHLLIERRQDMEHLKLQISGERNHLEKLDHEVGERKAELQILETQIHRRQEEHQRLCREMDQELRLRNGQIEEVKGILEKLNEEQSHMTNDIDRLDGERNRIKNNLATEKENLRSLITNSEQLQSELGQLQQRISLQQSTIEDLKRQCQEKSSQLDRLCEDVMERQKILEDVDGQLKRKKSEMEHLRELVTAEKEELDQLNSSKQTIRSSLKQLKDEKALLMEQKSQLETKVQSLTREISRLDEQVTYMKTRLETIQGDCSSAEKAMIDAKRERERLSGEIRQLEQTLQSTRSQVSKEQSRRDACVEDFHRVMEQVQTRQKERDRLLVEVEQLNSQCRTHRIRSEELETQLQHLHEQKDQMTLAAMQRQEEMNHVTQTLAELKCNVEMEEERSAQLLKKTQSELVSLDSQIEMKQNELREMNKKLREVKNKMEDENRTLEHMEILETSLKEKEDEVNSNHEDKHQLAEALQRCYSELQAMRGDLFHERSERERLERVNKQYAVELQGSREALTDQERKYHQKIRKLQRICEEQRTGAGRLTEELNQSRNDYHLLCRQIVTQQEFLQHQRHMDVSLKAVKAELEMDLARKKTFSQNLLSTPDTADSGFVGVERVNPLSGNGYTAVISTKIGNSPTDAWRWRSPQPTSFGAISADIHSATAKLERDAEEYYKLTHNMRTPSQTKQSGVTRRHPILYSNGHSHKSTEKTTHSSVDGLHDRLVAIMHQYTNSSSEPALSTTHMTHEPQRLSQTVMKNGTSEVVEESISVDKEDTERSSGSYDLRNANATESGIISPTSGPSLSSNRRENVKRPMTLTDC